jgi:aldose 1-epimerase
MHKPMIAPLLAALVLSLSANAEAAEVKAAPYGATKDGKAVTAYMLLNDKGASATILDFGGAIAAINVPDKDGKLGNVVMSFADVAGWEAIGHANSILGRAAQRIRNGFTLDSVHYPMQPNARGITQHSGAPSYATRIWKVEPIRKQDGAAVTLTLDSPDGDQGLPGHMAVKVTYRLDNTNALRLDYVATTDKATIVNLTNHIYLNLRGSDTPVWDHDLQIMADRVAAKDADAIPTGELQSVAGTPFDFSKPTKIADRLALAHDPAFVSADKAPPIPDGMVRTFDNSLVLRARYNRLDRTAVRLHDPASGRVLEMRTTEPSLQLYTPATGRAGVLNDAGKPFAPFAPAIAIETQHLPDSPNRPEFPSIVLRPGKTFHSTTIFAFTTDAQR